LISPVWESSERYWLVLPSRRQPEDRLHEHGEIIDACAARDPDLAAARVRRHLTDTAYYIAAQMDGELPIDLAGAGAGLSRGAGTGADGRVSAPGRPA
jgi:DNA-binding GntR family transcriptional regulator